MANTGQPVPIANLTLSSSQAYVQFSSIPQGFAHLYLEYKVSSSNTTGNVAVLVNFNNDTTGSNYSYWTVQGFGSAGNSAYGTADSSFFGLCTTSTSAANAYAANTAHIPLYSATNKYKSSYVDATSVNNSNETKFYEKTYNLWKSTSAINTIKLTCAVGNFMSGSTFTLYGVNNTVTNGSGTATTTP
jgi:hypothetical protein